MLYALLVPRSLATLWKDGKSMYEGRYFPPQLSFNLNRYQRDENGLVASAEDAREIIRNLQGIIHFLETSPFEQLPLTMQAEIALYLVGTHLLTHSSGDQQDAKAAAFEAVFNEHFDELIKGERSLLEFDDILGTVEEMFKGFGKEDS